MPAAPLNSRKAPGQATGAIAGVKDQGSVEVKPGQIMAPAGARWRQPVVNHGRVKFVTYRYVDLNVLYTHTHTLHSFLNNKNKRVYIYIYISLSLSIATYLMFGISMI